MKRKLLFLVFGAFALSLTSCDISTIESSNTNKVDTPTIPTESSNTDKVDTPTIPTESGVQIGYYKDINLESNELLLNSLHEIISKDTYDVTYAGLWDCYPKTDVKPGTDIVWDMYSNESFNVYNDHSGNSSSKEGDMFNREHAIPQSWFNKQKPMVSDLFHVYPTDAKVNNMRGSFLYGEVSNPTYTSKNGSKLGPSANSGYSGTAFEPIDEYKGDFARTYFYMATRYSDKVGSWTNGEASKVFKGSFPYLTDYALDLFVKWSKLDPVSEKEIIRNNEVAKIQLNRNPYIDHPEFIDIIYEGKNISDVTISNKEYPLPTTKPSVPSESNSKPTTPSTVPTVDDIDINNDIVTFPFVGLNFGYTLNKEVSVGGFDFQTNSAYGGGSLRIGHNKQALAINSKYGITGNGGSLEMTFDVENVKSVEFTHGTEYQMTNWYIVASTDGGSTWNTVASGASGEATYKATFNNPYPSVRFALIITGATNKFARSDIESLILIK